MRAVSNIIQERRLLEEIESPFICNLRYAFQDDENLFMVLDLMLGGDLRFHLDRSGNMREDVVRFYIAELALGLDYLHKLQIVHRDLKPDNVLLDEKGHAHLTDFNIAVQFSSRRPLTSVAGSMAYMAPEVLAKRGYLSSVDWWSLGVMAYELLFGRRPYRGKTNSALTHSILNDRCYFPDNVETIVSTETVSCIRALLERDVKKRLGCRNGVEDFKAHPWFASIDWTALGAKKINPPFEPDSKKANFDATHELEELLLEDNPLKAKKRDEKRDVATLTPEYRQMEEHFLQFDHLKQTRRSYFKNKRRATEHDEDNASHTSSAVYTLADQPLAEMGGPGTAGVAIALPASAAATSRGANSATSSVGIAGGANSQLLGSSTDAIPVGKGIANAGRNNGTAKRSLSVGKDRTQAAPLSNGATFPLAATSDSHQSHIAPSSLPPQVANVASVDQPRSPPASLPREARSNGASVEMQVLHPSVAGINDEAHHFGDDSKSTSGGPLF